MQTHKLIPTFIALLVAATVTGCTDTSPPRTSDPAPTEPRPATSVAPAPTTATSAPPPPPPPAPGLAHNETYTPLPSESLPEDGFTVAVAWTELTLSVVARHTAPCYFLASDPPSGTGTGPAPAVTFHAPSGSAHELRLPASNTCSSDATGPIGVPIQTVADPEQGDWRITFTGRGLNVELDVRAAGE